MAGLKELLAINMREKRQILGISQATLAERVNTSTHYIAMIELERKTPSLPMIERIAEALSVEPPELFSMKYIPIKTIKALEKSAMANIQEAVEFSVNETIAKLEKGELPINTNSLCDK